MKTKLTLSIDGTVIAEAKKIFKEEDISISEIIENQLKRLIFLRKKSKGKLPMDEMLGALKDFDLSSIKDDRFQHIVKKHLK